MSKLQSVWLRCKLPANKSIVMNYIFEDTKVLDEIRKEEWTWMFSVESKFLAFILK